MRTPKYRFLVGTHLQATGSYSAGYYNKATGQLVTSSVTDRKYALVSTDLPEGTQFYLAADNTFLKDNSYLTFYNGNLFLGMIQLSSIMGKPYTLPSTVTSVGITLDVTEMETDNPRPVYILHEADAVYSKLTKKIAKESGQMFFRETLDTDMHFVGFEADTIQACSIEDKFMVICQRWSYTNSTWVAYHADTFNLTDCNFDLAAHSCKPKLTPLDNYSRLMARYSDEYDLIKLKPEICKIRTSLRPIIEIYEKGSGVITRFLGGTYWETEINSPVDDDTVLTDTEHFGRVTLSDNFAHINVVEVYQGYESYLPKQEYMYDAGNNYYVYTDSPNVYTWSFVTLQDGFFNKPFLILERNGSRVVYGTRWIVIKLPSRVQSASDLPLDFGYSQFDVYGYHYDAGFTDLPMGKVTINLYDVWARVVGNSDNLFGIASYDLPQDDFAVDSPSYKKCAPINKDQDFFYITADTTTNPTEYGIKEDETVYYTNENLPIEGGLHGVKPMPIGKYEWGAFSFWFNYPDNYTLLELESRYDYDLRDCFTLGATIRALLAKIDPSVVFNDSVDCSQFFYNPYGLGVTMKGGYDWKLAITPKSNVLKGDYDQAAQKAPITFEELMGLLRDLYNLYWYIDDDRYLHIEHLTWFLNGGSYNTYQGSVQLDLTDSTVRDAFNKKMTGYWQKAYEFNMSEAARRLELTYAEKGTEFFEGLSVDVLNNYLREASTNSKSVSNFTADLDLMRIEPNRYSSDGFALLAYLDIVTPQPPYEPTGFRAVPVTGVVVTEADGWQRQAYINNLFASWLYCQHFYMYNLSGDNMKVNLKLESLPNGSSLDFVHGLARLRKQKVRFPFDNDPDMIDLIRTDLGYGAPESFEIDALSRTVEATLSFPVKDIPVE